MGEGVGAGEWGREGPFIEDLQLLLIHVHVQGELGGRGGG